MQAKKSYGQHFLKHESIAVRIADSLLTGEKAKNVIEVGPGMGILTKQLLEKRDLYQLWAVEADQDMVDYLKKNYPELGEHLLFRDFLDFRPEEVLGEEQFCIIGNFPYNISTQILFKMLDYRQQVPELVGMFQKEVADRVVAPPGSKVYGITSVLLQAYYTTEYLFTVERGSFNPPPKVLSAVIRLTRKDGFELGCDEKLFKNMVKTAFNQRRKMLRNTLKPFFQHTDVDLMEDVYFQKRPEDLGWEEYVALTIRAQAK